MFLKSMIRDPNAGSDSAENWRIDEYAPPAAIARPPAKSANLADFKLQRLDGAKSERPDETDS
jgi:hypothetical protein